MACEGGYYLVHMSALLCSRFFHHPSVDYFSHFQLCNWNGVYILVQSLYLQPLNRIRSLTGSKYSMSIEFVFFGHMWKPRWLPLCLISCDIFDFFSAINTQNSSKLARKQVSNSLYKFVFVRPVGKTKSCHSHWLAETFYRILLCNHWKEFKNLDKKQDFHIF